MSDKPVSFHIRVELCKAWQGLRMEELRRVSGFKDAEFVHKAGFTGGAWSKETIIAMTLKSIEEHRANTTQ